MRSVFRALTDARLFERSMGPGGSKVTVQRRTPPPGPRERANRDMHGEGWRHHVRHLGRVYERGWI